MVKNTGGKTHAGKAEKIQAKSIVPKIQIINTSEALNKNQHKTGLSTDFKIKPEIQKKL